MLQVGASTLPTITDLITNIGLALTFIWGQFSTFLSTLQSNSLLMYVILVPIVLGVLGLVVKVVKRFGVK